MKKYTMTYERLGDNGKQLTRNFSANGLEDAVETVTEVEMPFGKQVTFTMKNRHGLAITCTFFAVKKQVQNVIDGKYVMVDGFAIPRPSYISIDAHGRIETGSTQTEDLKATLSTRQMAEIVAFRMGG